MGSTILTVRGTSLELRSPDMTLPARKTDAFQQAGRPVRGTAKASPGHAANLFDTATNSMRDSPHSLPPTGRIGESSTEYIKAKHGKELASTNAYEQ